MTSKLGQTSPLELASRGFSTSATQNVPSKPLTITSLHKLLRNPYYKGEIRYRGVVYPGLHEPLVDPDTWQQVQDLLSSHSVAGTHQRTNNHCLRGSVYCGTCGSRLMVTTAHNRWRTEYLYLVCSGRARRITDCQRQAMSAEVIEELIEDEYRTIALSPALRDSIEELVLEDFDTLQAGSATERQQMESQRIELGAQRQKLLDARYAGAIPLDLMKSEQDRIAGQLARTEVQLASLDANFEQARTVLADTLDLTRDCHSAYLEANDSARRLFNQAFFAKIFIDEDDETRERSVRVDYNEPFDSLLSRLIPASVHHTLDIKKLAHPVTPEGGSEAGFENTEKVQGSHTDTLVVLARLFANSTPSPLTRAINAYHKLDLSEPRHIREGRVHTKRAKRLSMKQCVQLAQHYERGATVYDLASEYAIDRRTVSLRLRDQGVILRRHSPTDEMIDEMVRLYFTGLSAANVGEQLGVSADTVLNHLRQREVDRRAPHRPRS